MKRGAWIVMGVLATLVLAGIGATAWGWRSSAPPALPASPLAPVHAPEPTTFQTLANGTFDLHGATLTWEVRDFPEVTPGPLHAYEARIHRLDGPDGVRVTPAVLALEAPDGSHHGRKDFDRKPRMARFAGEHVEARVGAAFHRDAPDVAARLVLHVHRQVAVGYVQEDDHEARLPIPIRVRAPVPPV